MPEVGGYYLPVHYLPIIVDWVKAQSFLFQIMVDLAIVIVNYNTCDLLKDCLFSIFASEGNISFTVVVVDNASTDNSAAMVESQFPQVELIVSPVNGGFAYANNLGLRHVGFADKAPPSRSGTCPPRAINCSPPHPAAP